MFWVIIVGIGAIAGMNWWPIDPTDGQTHNCGQVTYY